MRCIIAASILALVGRTHAQSISIPVWYLKSYPSLPGGGQLNTPSFYDQYIAPDGTIGFLAFLGSDKVVCRVEPQGPVVLSRQNNAAPGSPGQVFADFISALPGSDGVNFVGSLTPSATVGFYRAESGGVWRYLVVGDPAPGIPGATVATLGTKIANGAWAAFTGSIVGTGTGEVLWAGAPGAMNLLARKNTQAPGMAPGRIFSTLLDTPSVNASGVVAFSAAVNPAPLTYGIWTAAPTGPTTLLLQSGDPTPGIPGGTFCWFHDPVLNAAGDMAFGAGVCTASGERLSLWVRVGGVLSLIAMEGQTAPGTNSPFYNLLPVAGAPTMTFTNDGLLVFRSTLNGPGVSTANDTGIWAGRPGALHLIARLGDQAAGFPTGQTYQSMTQSSGAAFAANALGHIVFNATISGANGMAIFVSDEHGNTTPAIRSGMLIPTDPGQTDTLSTFYTSGDQGGGPGGRPTFLDDVGRFVVHAYLQSPTFGTRRALMLVQLPPACFANCDQSTAAPILNANDFQCFLNRFASGDLAANCDGSTAAPVLNANDFQCFLNAYAEGCN